MLFQEPTGVKNTEATGLKDWDPFRMVKGTCPEHGDACKACA
jgi:hypothetical protein